MTQDHIPGMMRLIDPLPAGNFIIEPQEIDRLLIRMQDDGGITISGPRELIEQFLSSCAEEGLTISTNYISFCG